MKLYIIYTAILLGFVALLQLNIDRSIAVYEEDILRQSSYLDKEGFYYENLKENK